MRILFLLIAILSPFLASAADVVNATSTITVQGEAVTKIAPDQVALPVTVREENSNLKTAKQKHDDKLRGLLKLAADTGIDKDKIQTNFTAVNPVYDYPSISSKPVLRGYQVQTSVDFKLTDFSKLGDFMDGIVALGIDNIGSVSYTLQDEQKIKDDTLVKALTHAFNKASRLATTANVTLDKPIAIQENEAQVLHPVMPRMMAAKASFMSASVPPAPDLPAGLIEIHQNITVTYAIK